MQVCASNTTQIIKRWKLFESQKRAAQVECNYAQLPFVAARNKAEFLIADVRNESSSDKRAIM